jgi:hypothetical protein
MYIYIILQRQKVIKKSQTNRNNSFFLLFCLIEESGAGSVFVPLTNGYREAQKLKDHTDPDPEH